MDPNPYQSPRAVPLRESRRSNAFRLPRWWYTAVVLTLVTFLPLTVVHSGYWLLPYMASCFCLGIAGRIIRRQEKGRAYDGDDIRAGNTRSSSARAN